VLTLPNKGTPHELRISEEMNWENHFYLRITFRWIQQLMKDHQKFSVWVYVESTEHYWLSLAGIFKEQGNLVRSCESHARKEKQRT
jgi:hypothetical protein